MSNNNLPFTRKETITYENNKADLYQGDCLAVMDYLISIGVKVDAVIADIPYGTTACKWDSVIPFPDMWERLNKLIKPTGAIVLFGAEPFSSALRMSNIKNYKYDWIWEKTRPSNPALANKRPLSYSENIHIFYKKLPTYNPQKKRGKKNNAQGKGIRKTINKSNLPSSKKSYMNNPNSDMKFPKNIIKFDRGEIQVHPTQKPVALMEYLIKTYTNENELVLDFTAGSFSTNVACKNINRSSIGIEQLEKYFDIGISRLNENYQVSPSSQEGIYGEVVKSTIDILEEFI